MHDGTDSQCHIRTADLPAKTLLRLGVSATVQPLHWTPPSPQELENLWPDFEILSLLGRGGMGAVYQARQRSLQRLVAIKLLPREMGADEDFRRRFLREGRVMAHLQHERILRAYDFGETSEHLLFIVMEFLEGGTLHDQIAARSLLPAQALIYAAQVCEGLAYAHEQGVIHRDLKPSNVLLSVAGAKLADFGISRPTALAAPALGHTTGTLCGTREYAAPETLEQGRADARSDVYSLGILLYEALCGQLPRGHFAPPSERVVVDPRVDAIISRAIQSEPALRYASARAMLEDLHAINAGGSSSRVPPPGARKSVWLPRLAPVLFSALLLAFVLLAVVAVLHQRRAKSSTRSAENGPAHDSTRLAACPWQRWPSADEQLPPSLLQTAEGFKPRHPVAPVKLLCGPHCGSQAVRIQYTADIGDSNAMARPILHSSSNGESYTSIYAFAKCWQLFRREGPRYFELKRFDYSSRPVLVWHSLELSTEGSKLTLLADGELHEWEAQNGLPAGSPGFVLAGGVVVRKIEWRGVPLP